MEKINYENLARVVTKAGVILVESGAEIYRVEDTMYRLCKAYGATTVDAYATPTLLIISFTINGELCHNIKRVHLKNTNLTKIEEVNKLSRRISKEPLPLAEFEKQLNLIDQSPEYSLKIMCLGATAIGFGFGYFHGGNFADAFWAGLIGFAIAVVQNYLEKFDIPNFIKCLFESFILTFLACICGQLGWCHRDTAIIASIMILVPGVPITNAVRDSVSGDLVSGIARSVEAIVVAVAIAIGSAIALILFGGN